MPLRGPTFPESSRKKTEEKKLGKKKALPYNSGAGQGLCGVSVLGGLIPKWYDVLN
jgi:hypothetical protein